ncbi:MAG: M50 family metallopeptidase, partial [Anaerolineae bacterium]|nr:M50 family metallopeptidase [Anaerolineae bacterium]
MTIINIVGFILIFGILVFVHELGHFLAARRNGIVTEEFGFGYPPRVVTLRKGDGKLVVDDKALVVPGGYELPEDLVAGSLVTIQTTPDKKGRPVLTNVEVISPDDPLRSNAGVVSMIDPGTIYSINAIPFGGFVRMRGEDGPAGPGSFANASAGARAVTLLAGPGMNLLLAVIIFSISFMLGRPDAVPGGRIDEVAPGSPAELAGLAVGDRIFLIGDKEVRTASDVGDYVQAHPGEPVAMTIDRNGERMVVTLTPRVSPPEGQGPVGVTVYPVTEITRYGVGESLIRGAEDTARFTYFTLSVPSMLMKGVITPSEARPVGPKAIFDLTSGAITATQDSGLWFPVLQLMGILSAALAITNLLPIPAL